MSRGRHPDSMGRLVYVPSSKAPLFLYTHPSYMFLCHSIVQEVNDYAVRSGVGCHKFQSPASGQQRCCGKTGEEQVISGSLEASTRQHFHDFTLFCIHCMKHPCCSNSAAGMALDCMIIWKIFRRPSTYLSCPSQPGVVLSLWRSLLPQTA